MENEEPSLLGLAYNIRRPGNYLAQARSGRLAQASRLLRPDSESVVVNPIGDAIGPLAGVSMNCKKGVKPHRVRRPAGKMCENNSGTGR